MDYKISSNTLEIIAKLTELKEVAEGLEFLKSDHDKAIEDQLELVVIKAPTFHEQERAARYAEMFKELGLTNVHIDSHCNVIGVKKGLGDGSAIVIEGHLDTVFPFEVEIKPVIKDGKIHAPGICDDTRGLAAVLSVIRAFNETKVEHSGDIYFAGMAAEEGMGGFRGMKGFFEDNKGKIAASITIDGGGADRIVYNATGIKTMEFNFYGIGGHAFGAFANVANPLHAAARCVAKIAQLKVPGEPKTTYSVSKFHAGSDAGVHAITEYASFKINFRSNGVNELNKLEADILRAAEEACKEESEFWGKDTITHDYKYLVDVPAGVQDINAPIVEATYAAIKHIGVEPAFMKDGCTNANIPVGLGVPAICIGRGGKESGVHTTHEWFEIEGAYRCPQEVFLIALALSGVKGKTKSVLYSKITPNQ
ncbi:MAG: M20/M25/M40 family metallo-hydrolase [Defluviitaleaceae bacterium]|nr:M20/M25/M40 family metallo-hydrolase [Defluviitaleaceae bacterium]